MIRAFSRVEIEWLESIKNIKPIISIQHPNWKGIKSSSYQLFDYHYEIPDNISNEEIEHHAHVLMESSCKAIVLQGFPNSFYYLIEYLNRKKTTFQIYLIYHGNFMHTSEDYSWWAFKSIIELAKAKKIKKVGFVKQGLAEVVANQGIETAFVLNYYKKIPKAASNPLANGKTNIGIWTNGTTWQKSPYAMIAACSMIKNSKLFGSGFNQRSVELALLMGIDYNISYESIPHVELLKKMSQMHVNLYVTFSECAPMLPLESLAMGVPCLIGSNNHYFQNNDYLHQKLVVQYPDKSFEIAKKTMEAIDERELIILEYIKYAVSYNEQAKQSVINFIEK